MRETLAPALEAYHVLRAYGDADPRDPLDDLRAYSRGIPVTYSFRSVDVDHSTPYNPSEVRPETTSSYALTLSENRENAHLGCYDVRFRQRGKITDEDREPDAWYELECLSTDELRAFAVMLQAGIERAISEGILPEDFWEVGAPETANTNREA